MPGTRIGLAIILVLLAGCRKPADSSGAPASPPVTAPAAMPVDPAGKPATIPLLHENDLDNWTFDLDQPGAAMGDVWSIRDGLIACSGRPVGVLCTRESYENYVLDLEWRWPAGTPGGNNGVLVHASDPRVLGVWPRSIEVQLAAGQAGDFWIIGTTLHVPEETARRKDRRYFNLTDGSEKPLGEWNHMQITCRADTIAVSVNGQHVNRATDCSVTRGAICLQSEGAPIEYRSIRLTQIARSASQ